MLQMILFLSSTCYQEEPFKSSQHVFFEIPNEGGHVGFSDYSKNGTFWSDQRAFEFISENC